MLPLELRELPLDQAPWALLLLADPSPEQVERYLANSRLLALCEGEAVRGVLALTPVSWGVLEITNLAVDEAWQGKGLGKRLLAAAIEAARTAGALRLDIATGNSSLAQLGLYQRMGFRICAVEPDYFTLNYPEPIVENGIACRDRLRLRLSLVL